MYQALVVKDSIAHGVRLTTVAVTLPRIMLAEQNTHRDFSRNAASSRAIPIPIRCDGIEKDPFVPEVFGKNQKGMQSSEVLDPEDNAKAELIWREALSDALRHARRLADVRVHKEYANRITEPFSWVTQLITATSWDNYMNLRIHSAAQREIQKAARLIKDAMDSSTPKELKEGEWHLPFVEPGDETISSVVSPEMAAQLPDTFYRFGLFASVARCAAVSYERQNTKKAMAEEIDRHNSLKSHGHMSPFEHQAKVASADEVLKTADFRWSEEKQTFVARAIGNFSVPWLQYRKQIPGERVFSFREF